MLDWMVWTLPVAVFFGCVALLLAGMTWWELKSPTVERKGFLPIATTRGAGAASVAELIDRADQALYRSKRTGRNRVSMFAGPQAASLVL